MRHCLAPLIFAFCTLLGIGGTNLATAQSAGQDMGTTIKGQTLGPDGKEVYQMSITVPPPVAEEDNHYLAKLRDQLNAYNMDQAMKDRGTHVSFLKFTNETAAFFVAIGAVQFQKMLIDFSDNPSALAAHIKSAKDPIGHISFYMFLLTQGYTVHYLEGMFKEKNDVTMQVAKRFLGYGGMAAGTLISGITTDVLTGIKECAKTLFPNPKDSEQNDADLKACEAANKSLAGSKGAQKYTTQIVSLLATAGAVSFVETSSAKLATYSGAKLAKALALKSGSVFKAVGLQLAFLGSPEGWLIKGLSIVGKIGKFYFFTAGGEVVNPIFEKLLGNTFKPIEFHDDAKKFEAAVKDSKDNNWQNERANLAVAKQLEAITDLMTRWRQQQLAKFYTAHSIWGENVLRVVDQTHTTFNFYKVYLDNLFKTLHVGTKIRNGQLPPAAMNNNTVTYYPFRTLPLYGVALDPDPMGLEVQEDQYLNQPVDLERRQKQKVHAASAYIKAAVAKMRLSPTDSEWLKDILAAFDGNDAKIMGQAILKMNTVAKGQALVKVEGKDQLQRVSISPELQRLMIAARRFLGDPNPIMEQGMGFSYAYETNTLNNKAMRTLERPPTTGVERVRTSDFMWIQMACGSVGDYYSNRPGSFPFFKPPKLIRKDIFTPELCRAPYDQRRTQDHHELDIYTQVYQASDRKTYNGINDLIYANIPKEILGDFTSDKGELNFANWWFENVNTSMTSLFKDLDAQYIHVLQHLTDNWNDKELSYLDRMNYSSYLGKDILENLSFELNIYANVLNDILNGRVAKDRKQSGGDGAPVEMEDLGKRAPVKNYQANLGQYISPTVKAAVSTTKPVIEDKQGLLLRLRGAADADVTYREKLADAAKARAAVNSAKAALANVQSTPGLPKDGGAQLVANYKAEIARLEKKAAEAERVAAQAQAQPQIQDTSLVRGDQYAKLKEIAEVIEATRLRIDILRHMRVVKGRDGQLFIENFPAKADSLKVAERTADAMKALADLLKGVQAARRIDPSQAEVASKALAGLESVISEVGTLTMSFYMTKYKLGDDAGQLLAELKASNIAAPKVKTGAIRADGQ
jgi:hypothetical protein